MSEVLLFGLIVGSFGMVILVCFAIATIVSINRGNFDE